MDFKELQKKSEKDLNKLLSELREKVQTLSFKVAADEVKNHQELKLVKKDVARILTLMKQKERNQDGK